jgi:hypothetical protein
VTTDDDYISACEDLEMLEWLKPLNPIDIFGVSIDILDNNTVALLNDRTRFNIMSVLPIKMKVQGIIYEITNGQTSELSVAPICEVKFSDLRFFDEANVMLKDCTDETLVTTFLKIEDLFQKMKKTLNALLIHVDKCFNRESGGGITDYLDETFLNKVITGHKGALYASEEAKPVVDTYDRMYKVKNID